MDDLMEKAVAKAMNALMSNAAEFGFEDVKDAIDSWGAGIDDEGTAPPWGAQLVTSIGDAFREVQDCTENMISIRIAYPNGDRIVWAWLDAEGHPGRDYHRAVVQSVQRALGEEKNGLKVVPIK